MTEGRTEYTTQPDELTQLRRQNRELSEKLDRQIAAWNGGTDALTAHAERQAHLAAVPVTLLRYIVTSHPSLPTDDRLTAQRWLNSLDGGA